MPGYRLQHLVSMATGYVVVCQTEMVRGVYEVATEDESHSPSKDQLTVDSDEEAEEEDYSLSGEEETDTEIEVTQLPS